MSNHIEPSFTFHFYYKEKRTKKTVTTGIIPQRKIHVKHFYTHSIRKAFQNNRLPVNEQRRFKGRISFLIVFASFFYICFILMLI